MQGQIKQVRAVQGLGCKQGVDHAGTRDCWWRTCDLDTLGSEKENSSCLQGHGKSDSDGTQ